MAPHRPFGWSSSSGTDQRSLAQRKSGLNASGSGQTKRLPIHRELVQNKSKGWLPTIGFAPLVSIITHGGVDF